MADKSFLACRQNNLTFGMQPHFDEFTRPSVDGIAAAAAAIDAGTKPTTNRCPAGSCKASLLVGIMSRDDSAIGAPLLTGARSIAQQASESAVSHLSMVRTHNLTPHRCGNQEPRELQWQQA